MTFSGQLSAKIESSSSRKQLLGFLMETMASAAGACFPTPGLLGLFLTSLVALLVGGSPSLTPSVAWWTGAEQTEVNVLAI